MAITTTSGTPTIPATSSPAGNFFRAHEGLSDIQGAIFTYNHSAQFVTDVLRWCWRRTGGTGCGDAEITKRFA